MARTLYRWIPKDHAPTALGMGVISHNNAAMWLFSLGTGDYKPGQGVYGGAILLAYTLDDTADAKLKMQTIDFEHSSFAGEAAHPTQIIVKSNEKGAIGIGKLRQHQSVKHVTVRYATKKEVAKALDKRESEVSDTYKPATGWP